MQDNLPNSDSPQALGANRVPGHHYRPICGVKYVNGMFTVGEYMRIRFCPD